MSRAARARRQAVREQAAEMFAQARTTAEIAYELRVSPKSVRQWRRRWIAGGVAGLASAGAGGAACKLSTYQQARLSHALDDGPAVYGWADQRWTLARVAELIERLFAEQYTPRGVSYLLHRLGYSLQVPARRAIERDEAAITGWHRTRWPAVKG
jgi:putative transposase